MPALSSPDRKVTHYRRGARSADWSTFLSDLADTSKKYVRAPAGEFEVTSTITIRGEDRLIDMDGCILDVDDLTIQPMVISSVSNAEENATGTIDANTRTLTITDSDFLATIQVGDHHFIRIGVQTFDPQEPLYSVLRHVESIEGSVVTYDSAFGIASPVYATEAELEALTQYPERVGPWGVLIPLQDGDYFGRGLGQDHGIRAITTLTRNITIRNMVLRYDGTEEMYGAWGLLVGMSEGVRIENLLVINPHGSAVHWYFAQGCVLDGMVVNGIGRGDPFNEGFNAVYAVMVTGWSANDCQLINSILDGTDIELSNFESGCRRLTFQDVLVRNVHSGTTDSNPHFGFFGPGDILYDRISVDIAAASSRLITYSWDSEIRNLNILTAAMPDTIQWDGVKGDFTGGLTWADETFSAPEQVVVDFSVLTPNGAIPYPDGIIMECTFAISDRSKFTNFNVSGSDPFVASAPDGLVFSKIATANQIAFGKTYAQYRADLATHRIYTQNGGGAVSMEVKIMRRVVD